jgi:hypothetical protein
VDSALLAAARAPAPKPCDSCSHEPRGIHRRRRSDDRRPLLRHSAHGRPRPVAGRCTTDGGDGTSHVVLVAEAAPKPRGHRSYREAGGRALVPGLEDGRSRSHRQVVGLRAAEGHRECGPSQPGQGGARFAPTGQSRGVAPTLKGLGSGRRIRNTQSARQRGNRFWDTT